VVVNDGANNSNQIDVSLTVTNVNDAPVANDDPVTPEEGTSTRINLASNDSDSDGDLDPSSIRIISGPSNGTLTINDDGTVDYLHDGSETTSDSFTYTIDDLSGATSNTATVNITVTPVNDAPTITAGQSFSIQEDAISGDSVGTIKASDPDSGTLTYSIVPTNDVNAFAVTSGDNVSTFAVTTADGSGVFRIDSRTGEISVAGPLDYETVSTYALTVEVSDGITSSRSNITINITDVDEQPPAPEEDDQLASRSLPDGTEQTSGTYTGSATSGSSGYYEDWDSSDDHGSDEVEYVREAVTDDVNGPEKSNPEGSSTPEPAIDLAAGDLTVLLEAPAAGEAEAAQELNEALQQESEKFEQDRKQLIETLDEVSDFLRCG
jgi:VCBS repeat-containing protein